MDFVRNYPTEEKVNNAKVQIYQPLSSCFNSNSTFHDSAMCVGQLYNGTMENKFVKKMVQVEDWLTHYLTQFNGERPAMVSVFWDDRMTVFVSYTFVLTLFFSGELIWWQSCSCLQNTLRDLRAEVQRFSKVNHLVWSTWSVIQVNDNHSILQNKEHEFSWFAGCELQHRLRLLWVRKNKTRRVPQVENRTMNILVWEMSWRMEVHLDSTDFMWDHLNICTLFVMIFYTSLLLTKITRAGRNLYFEDAQYRSIRKCKY